MKKKFKRKSFLRIFFILMIIEFIVVISDMFLQRADSAIASVTSMAVDIISMPISLINTSLPFYTPEGLHVSILLWLLNLTIQTMIVYGIILMFKILKDRN